MNTPKLRNKRILIEFKKLESKFEMKHQMIVGIIAGMVSGLLVIMPRNFYDLILKYTGNTFIAFFIGLFVAFLLIYFFLGRPLNKIKREIKDFEKKYLQKNQGSTRKD